MTSACSSPAARGFVGCARRSARSSRARRAHVRCLVAPGSRRDNLAGLAVEIVEGDLTDPASLARAMTGVPRALPRRRRLPALDAATRGSSTAPTSAARDNILRAAADAGVSRVVYTSSVGALGADAGRHARRREHAGRARAGSSAHYKESKFDAERVAPSGRRGLPVVIVNPSTPVGERDIKPTPTGQMIVDFLNRRMPAYVDTGLNLVDVRDVAAGHLLAARAGKARRALHPGPPQHDAEGDPRHARATHGPALAANVRLPHWIPLVAPRPAPRAAARHAARPPRVSLESVRMSTHRMYFDAARAVRELGLPQTPVEEALARAVEWFRANGYVRG